jgi:GntR family transcriptional regulator
LHGRRFARAPHEQLGCARVNADPSLLIAEERLQRTVVCQMVSDRLVDIERRRVAFDQIRRGRAPARPAQTSSRRTYEQLRASLRSGLLGREEQLAETLIGEALGASRNSVRRALQMLAEEGLLNRQPRNGTSIARGIIQIPAGEIVPREVFNEEDPPSLGIESLSAGAVPTTALIRSRLDTDDEQVFMTEQVFSLDGEPIFLRTGYMLMPNGPQWFLDRSQTLDSDPPPYEVAFELLFGVPFGTSESVIEAVPCEERTAESLGIQKGTPVLLREVLVRDFAGKPRDVSYCHFRGDRVALSCGIAGGFADGPAARAS